MSGTTFALGITFNLQLGLFSRNHSADALILKALSGFPSNSSKMINLRYSIGKNAITSKNDLQTIFV